uniref:Tetratricopeptide repeat-containing protein n=1 Tax=Candidatus Kentrum sp. MB TaxID=2138164 RepID=A0A450XLV2_9GAMM|nr:MAG: Tetratricopeptide repeat-containing protein [Candidatus Kentron sp. MB]VFK30281.1 MAG: Tetratricopeptide repeat-containing protein [Candidatus Kentron sp. MB]VFK74293.1 MAG: Tetratricopeptide repeat-containing protein [Candidatus Kentron sp. MB]
MQPPETKPLLDQLRAAHPDLKSVTDQQLMELLQQAMQQHMANIDPTDKATLDRMSARELRVLGERMLSQGKWPEAEPVLLRILERSEQEGDREQQIWAMIYLGRLCSERGDFPEAYELFQQALAQAERLGEKRPQGAIYSEIGDILATQSQYPLAITHYRKSLEIGEALRHEQDLAVFYGNLADVYINAIYNFPRSARTKHISLIYG